MNKLYVLTLSLALFAINGNAQLTMPVLKIRFDGSFKQGMSYINGTMQLTDEDGNVTAMNSEFKTRGATAASYMMKPSFNMRLRNDDYSEEVDSTLLGLRSCSSWILDAMAIDRICMRNRVGFDIWNEFSKLPYETDFDGRNGTVGKFVEVYINDKYYGIYCMTDRINRKLLNLKKVVDDGVGGITIRGVLYKSGTLDIDDQNNPGYNEDSTACTIAWHDAWELTEPEDYGCAAAWAPLKDCYANGKNVSYIKKYFYLNNLAEYEIMIMALSIADNWGNKNKFLSVRNIQKDIDDSDSTESNRRRFVITPWDLDTDLGGYYNGDYYGGNYSDWKVTEAVNNGGPYPFPYLGGDAEYNALLKQKWIEGRKGAFSCRSVFLKLEKYRDLFVNSGAWMRMTDYFETQKNRPCYVLDLNSEIESIKVWYKARFKEMDKYFGVNAIAEDVNADGTVDTQDILSIYNYMLNNAETTESVPQDVNGDDKVDTQDVLAVYYYMQNR